MAEFNTSRFSSMAEGTGTIRISGAKEMEQVLRRLPDYIAQKVVLEALRKAAEPILDEARALAPVGQESKGRVRLRQTRRGVVVSNYGKLKLNLKIINITKYREYSATVAVTVGKAFWGMFLEFGTRHRTHNRSCALPLNQKKWWRSTGSVRFWVKASKRPPPN